ANPSRAADRHLLRAPGLVPAAVRGAGPPRNAVRKAARRRARVRSRRGSAVLAGLQPHEPVGVPARARRRHLLHALVAVGPGAPGRARRQRLPGVRERDQQGRAAGPARRAGAAVSQGPRDPPRRAGARRRRGAALAHRREAQHWRKRRRRAALRLGRRAARRGRFRVAGPGHRQHGAGA
ncbi:MAG: FIG00685563: hypothetical protein, partial [uncultured Gemmatimonadetes bacterium]